MNQDTSDSGVAAYRIPGHGYIFGRNKVFSFYFSEVAQRTPIFH
jgi:hypothetical protein